jgi:hypothetical protein
MHGFMNGASDKQGSEGAENKATNAFYLSYKRGGDGMAMGTLREKPQKTHKRVLPRGTDTKHDGGCVWAEPPPADLELIELQKRLEENGDDWFAWMTFGWKLHSKPGKEKQAIDMFHRAWKCGAVNHEMYQLLADYHYTRWLEQPEEKCHRPLEELETCLQAYGQVLADDKLDEDAALLHKVAGMYVEYADYQGALGVLARIISQHASYVHFVQVLHMATGLMCHLDMHSQSLPYLEHVWKQRPTTFEFSSIDITFQVTLLMQHLGKSNVMVSYGYKQIFRLLQSDAKSKKKAQASVDAAAEAGSAGALVDPSTRTEVVVVQPRQRAELALVAARKRRVSVVEAGGRLLEGRGDGRRASWVGELANGDEDSEEEGGGGGSGYSVHHQFEDWQAWCKASLTWLEVGDRFYHTHGEPFAALQFYAHAEKCAKVRAKGNWERRKKLKEQHEMTDNGGLMAWPARTEDDIEVDEAVGWALVRQMVVHRELREDDTAVAKGREALQLWSGQCGDARAVLRRYYEEEYRAELAVNDRAAVVVQSHVRVLWGRRKLHAAWRKWYREGPPAAAKIQRIARGKATRTLLGKFWKFQEQYPGHIPGAFGYTSLAEVGAALVQGMELERQLVLLQALMRQRLASNRVVGMKQSAQDELERIEYDDDEEDEGSAQGNQYSKRKRRAGGRGRRMSTVQVAGRRVTIPKEVDVVGLLARMQACIRRTIIRAPYKRVRATSVQLQRWARGALLRWRLRTDRSRRQWCTHSAEEDVQAALFQVEHRVTQRGLTLESLTEGLPGHDSDLAPPTAHEKSTQLAFVSCMRSVSSGAHWAPFGVASNEEVARLLSAGVLVVRSKCFSKWDARRMATHFTDTRHKRSRRDTIHSLVLAGCNRLGPAESDGAAAGVAGVPGWAESGLAPSPLMLEGGEGGEGEEGSQALVIQDPATSRPASAVEVVPSPAVRAAAEAAIAARNARAGYLFLLRKAGLEKWPAKEERKKGKAGRATLGGEGEGSEGAAEGCDERDETAAQESALALAPTVRRGGPIVSEEEQQARALSASLAAWSGATLGRRDEAVTMRLLGHAISGAVGCGQLQCLSLTGTAISPAGLLILAEAALLPRHSTLTELRLEQQPQLGDEGADVVSSVVLRKTWARARRRLRTKQRAARLKRKAANDAAAEEAARAMKKADGGRISRRQERVEREERVTAAEEKAKAKARELGRRGEKAWRALVQGFVDEAERAAERLKAKEQEGKDRGTEEEEDEEGEGEDGGEEADLKVLLLNSVGLGDESIPALARALFTVCSVRPRAKEPAPVMTILPHRAMEVHAGRGRGKGADEDEDAQLVGEAAGCEGMQTLSLCDNHLGDYGVIQLVQMLLKLGSSTGSSSTGPPPLATLAMPMAAPSLGIGLSSLTELLLAGNGPALGDRAAVALSMLLVDSSCALERLDLCRNGVGDEGALAIASALRRHNPWSLRKLVLTDNPPMGAVGIRALAAVRSFHLQAALRAGRLPKFDHLQMDTVATHTPTAIVTAPAPAPAAVSPSRKSRGSSGRRAVRSPVHSPTASIVQSPPQSTSRPIPIGSMVVRSPSANPSLRATFEGGSGGGGAAGGGRVNSARLSAGSRPRSGFGFGSSTRLSQTARPTAGSNARLQQQWDEGGAQEERGMDALEEQALAVQYKRRREEQQLAAKGGVPAAEVVASAKGEATHWRPGWMQKHRVEVEVPLEVEEAKEARSRQAPVQSDFTSNEVIMSRSTPMYMQYRKTGTL